MVRRFISSEQQAVAVKTFPRENRGVIGQAVGDQAVQYQYDDEKREVDFIKRSQCFPPNTVHHFFRRDTRDGDRPVHTSRIVMPLVQGELAYKVFAKRSITHRQVASYILLMTEALMSLHQKGIIHGDIKLNNIYIYRKSPHQKVTFIDFGHSYWSSEEEAIATDDTRCKYWAPERVSCRTIPVPHANQDTYSFGYMIQVISERYLGTPFLTTYRSIDSFIQTALNRDPMRRPTLESFYCALTLDLSASVMSDEQEDLHAFLGPG